MYYQNGSTTPGVEVCCVTERKGLLLQILRIAADAYPGVLRYRLVRSVVNLHHRFIAIASLLLLHCYCYCGPPELLQEHMPCYCSKGKHRQRQAPILVQTVQVFFYGLKRYK